MTTAHQSRPLSPYNKWLYDLVRSNAIDRTGRLLISVETPEGEVIPPDPMDRCINCHRVIEVGQFCDAECRSEFAGHKNRRSRRHGAGRARNQ